MRSRMRVWLIAQVNELRRSPGTGRSFVRECADSLRNGKGQEGQRTQDEFVG